MLKRIWISLILFSDLFASLGLSFSFRITMNIETGSPNKIFLMKNSFLYTKMWKKNTNKKQLIYRLDNSWQVHLKIYLYHMCKICTTECIYKQNKGSHMFFVYFFSTLFVCLMFRNAFQVEFSKNCVIDVGRLVGGYCKTGLM